MLDVPVPLTILQALADETRRRLELAGQIEHPGESGRAREQILTAFIEQLVPSSFGVSTGFVVDALGGKSRQLDVVVYQTDYAPVFEIGRVKHFLAESVVAVLEVKAAIDSERDLTQALDNIASVKGLDRSNRGRNRLSINRMQIGRKADPNDHEARILGAIVTEQSLVSDFSEDFRAWLRAHPRHEWPNLYIDVHRFAALYRYLHPEDRYLHPEDRSPGNVVGTNAMTAEEFIVSDPTNEAPLVVLGYELPNWFRVVPTMTSIRWTTSRIDHRSINRGRFLRSAQPRSNRQIRSLVLCVDLVGSRRIWPAHIGRVVGPDGSRRILSDRLDDQTDDQAMRRGALGHPDDGRHCGAVTRYSIW